MEGGRRGSKRCGLVEGPLPQPAVIGWLLFEGRPPGPANSGLSCLTFAVKPVSHKKCGYLIHRLWNAGMKRTTKRKPIPTTPEQEGIDLHPDSWERFVDTFDKVVTAPPIRRTAAKPTAANRKPRAPKHGG